VSEFYAFCHTRCAYKPRISLRRVYTVVLVRRTRLTNMFDDCRELHWLPITERIQYKLCLLVHKMFVGHTPDYIASLLMPASDIPSRLSLRSLSNCDLVVPKTSRKIGDRAFSVAAPRAWNRLQTDLKLLRSTASFKSKLEEFSASCCLHLERCVNSGMRHRSDCGGRTTSHCCYCYSRTVRRTLSSSLSSLI